MSGRVLSERWLGQALSAITYDGTPVKVYRQPAPAGVAYPFITVALTSAVDLFQLDSDHSYERMQYTIRAWDTGSSSRRVNAIAESIHDAIQRVPPVAVEGGQIVSCVRVGAIAYDSIQEQNGELFQIDGGVYRLNVVSQ